MRLSLTAAVVAVGVCLAIAGIALSAESNVYWRADLHQGSSIIAYGQGATADAALQDCYRLQATTRAMTAAETRRNAVAAVSANTVRWCNNVRRYSTVAPDPVTPVRTAVLSWTPPTRNTDGSTLNNLAGYRIAYGTSATALAQTIQIANPSATTYTVPNLAPGTYHFAVRAYTADGAESVDSNVVSNVVQ